MINEKNRLTSMNYWYPKLQGLPIHQPKTIIIPYNNPNFQIDLELSASKMGYPLFMRSDLSAAKQDWKNTCYVKDRASLHDNLMMLVESHQWLDVGGLPFTAIVLREFLDLTTGFLAFPGNMPISIERRYFIKDGEVVCHHPYWPREVFDQCGGWNNGYPWCKDGNWEDRLNQMNQESPLEVMLLTAYAEKISNRLPGYWSCDFVLTTKGIWYMIDMAVGEASYHWPGCPKGDL